MASVSQSRFRQMEEVDKMKHSCLEEVRTVRHIISSAQSSTTASKSKFVITLIVIISVPFIIFVSLQFIYIAIEMLMRGFLEMFLLLTLVFIFIVGVWVWALGSGLKVLKRFNLEELRRLRDARRKLETCHSFFCKKEKDYYVCSEVSSALDLLKKTI